jgi:mono/diheme cytochrome c family protein
MDKSLERVFEMQRRTTDRAVRPPRDAHPRGRSWRLGSVDIELVLAVGLCALLGVVAVGGAYWGSRSSSSGTAVAVSSGGGADTVMVSRGRETYMSVCIACHGANGEAKPGLGKDLRESTFFDGLTDEEAVAFLVQGRGPSDPLNTTGVQMPPKGGNPALGMDDLADIVAFVRSLTDGG